MNEKPIHDEDSDEEKVDESEQKLWVKINDILKEYHLSEFQKVACRKFIKDKIGNPDNKNVERLREWLFMRINGHKMPEKYHPR